MTEHSAGRRGIAGDGMRVGPSVAPPSAPRRDRAVCDQAEDLRRLVDQRNHLAQARQGLESEDCAPEGSPARVLAIASGKGGVGKTNIAVNVALMLAARGRQTLLLDADIGTANVDLLLNVNARRTLMDVLAGRCGVQDACIRLDENLRVLLGASGLSEALELGLPQRETLFDLMKHIEGSAEFVVMDCGAGVSRQVLCFAEAADDLWVVTTPEPTSLADAYALIKMAARGASALRIGIVVNGARSAREARAVADRLAGVAARFAGAEAEYAGHVLRDDHVVSAVRERAPVVLRYPDCPAAACISTLAEGLAGEAARARRGIGLFDRLWSVFC